MSLLKCNVEKNIAVLVEAVRGEVDESRAYFAVLQRLVAAAVEDGLRDREEERCLRAAVDASYKEACLKLRQLEEANKAKEEETKELERRNAHLMKALNDLRTKVSL